jgi:class 3 adenylate cyclase|tara:strand:+ start:783 stop:2144 length:1362 start_codon:yes stop_codon:yes gene_type:complete
MWKEKEHSDFLGVVRVFLPLAAAGYIAHYWMFDRTMGLEPESHWLTFRLSMAGIALLGLAYYLSPLANLRHYRIVAAAICATYCYFQARVHVWYPEAPWLYCFVFVILGALILRTSVFKSCLFALAVLALQWPSLLEAGLDIPPIVSAGAVSIIAIMVLRGSYAAEIKYFLLNQQNIDTQKKNIELNIEFADRLKSFIPKEIASRFESRLASDRDTTVLQAIYDVLTPRKAEIACLFSDIRGFTEGSKDLDQFIGESVVPNVKACTEAVETYNGIQRKIGDLLFAYFDADSVQLNLLRAILTGFAVAKVNEDQNQDSSKPVERYILISVGEAIVGNIGGFDSSVEITALGSPVNFLSRLDEATKHPEFKKHLSSSDLIVCDRSMEIIRTLRIPLEVVEINLRQLDIAVRNFGTTSTVYALRPSQYNRQLMQEYCNRINLKVGQTWNEHPSRAA